ncbi:MAG: nucleoside-diphosphate sugar epimerase/dehydratase [Proteobacteria bacterium]|nr:nucleoside-diphosphate sugar epimerase/dehydratase [Pseudomonadota bacterium]
MNMNRAHFAFAHDIFMAAASFLLALFLRLGNDIFSADLENLFLSTALFTLVAASVFWFMRMYRGIWRYASLRDLFNITKSVSLAILIFFVLMFSITRLDDLPRSLPFINWFVLIALLGGPRFIYRLYKDRRIDLRFERSDHSRIPVLLAGADDNAEMFIRAMARADSEYEIKGIVANSPGRVGRNIHGVEVLGDFDSIPYVVNRLTAQGAAPQRLIVPAGRYDGPMIRSLLDAAETSGMTLARLPALTDFRSSLSDDVEVRPIDVEDLLGRPQTPLDRLSMARLIEGRRVLVTGAGGSIGSELARQIASLSPAHLTLVENSEFNLYSIEKELKRLQPELSISALIGDVRDQARIEQIFLGAHPDLVFHAAALKHVPVVEENPREGVATNVLGTVNIANACRKFGVAAMVQISTDKAVNPTSIMGMTKRIAESYCQALDVAEGQRGSTRYVTVRFGNVLGSTGSGVELFKEQLARGGPLTVTHPDMTRYFMTAREAVELVLQAAALGNDGNGYEGKIFVLDMGEPVKILDLANQMIRLAGLQPGKDIAIEFSGVRAGEKLYEEVLHGAESPVPTDAIGLLLASPRLLDLDTVNLQIQDLSDACADTDEERLLTTMRDMVPEYARPDTSAATNALSA